MYLTMSRDILNLLDPYRMGEPGKCRCRDTFTAHVLHASNPFFYVYHPIVNDCVPRRKQVR